ncbi:MAG: metal ABC transporter permease [Bdellovibrionales bacterium]|nr:metal ABC transporter permease [Bdellovibrionales bacterium]
MGSLTDVRLELPAWDAVINVLLLQGGYNARVVVVGTALLGTAAGLIGTFALLRRRAMVGDGLAHAALPGLAIAYLISVWAGGEGRVLPVLLFGAAVSGVVGVLIIQFLSQATRLEEDAAIGIVLSVFFGAGVLLLSYIQSLGTGTEGGIQHFIYGQTAAMRLRDAKMIAVIAAVASACALLFLKEFRIVCFDREYAAVQGWPVGLIDLVMMALIVLVTIIGLQSVGLILVVALLVLPSVSARLWSDRLGRITFLSAGFGAVSGYVGSALSALFGRLPAGAVIVLTAGTFFALSLLFAPRRGVIAACYRQVRLRLRIETDHLLRGYYEVVEDAGAQSGVVPLDAIPVCRSWSPLHRLLILNVLRVRGYCTAIGGGISLTELGMQRARELTTNHRLWEQYLVTFGELPASHVDQSADMVEHVLSPEIVSRLREALLKRGRMPRGGGPLPSVHPIATDAGTMESGR